MFKYKVIHGLQSIEFETASLASEYVNSNNIPNQIEEIPYTTTTPSQFELDYVRYLNRGYAKDKIIAEMASQNMMRVRSGEWTVNQLINLTMDTELKNILDDVNTLSYELAVQKLSAISNPLITSKIKQDWINLLQAHFYL
jgi:hypothetical protein